MTSLSITVKLGEYLRANRVSVYTLAKTVVGLSESAVYAFAEGRKNPSLEGLAKIATALQHLTGKPLEVRDLLEFAQLPDPETAAWMDGVAGHLADNIARIEADLPPAQVKAWLEEQAKTVKPARYIPGRGTVLLEDL